MNRGSKAAVTLLQRFYLQIVLALILGPLEAWLVLSVFPPHTVSPLVAMVCSGLICSLGMAVFCGVYFVNRDNRRLKSCAVEFHDINHIYRDALCELFARDGGRQYRSREEVLDFERRVLNRVCDRIAVVFGNLIGRRCVATVILAVKGDESFCFTWARSRSHIYREDGQKLSLFTGKNTALDEALKFRASRPSFYYSPDLWRELDYQDERRNWGKVYRSIMVVPIRRVIDRAAGRVDLTGFLTVDTTSSNRMNETYEVEFLAGFADQMYNFLSIVRGRYVLPAEGVEAERGGVASSGTRPRVEARVSL